PSPQRPRLPAQVEATQLDPLQPRNRPRPRLRPTEHEGSERCSTRALSPRLLRHLGLDLYWLAFDHLLDRHQDAGSVDDLDIRGLIPRTRLLLYMSSRAKQHGSHTQ